MNDLLSQLGAVAGQGWIVFGIVFLRVGAAMALLPGFGDQKVPSRVRLGLALAFSLVVLPAAAGQLPDEPDLRFALRCLPTETAAGLLIGLALRLTILALETAGTIAAQSTSLAQMFPGAAEPMPVLSHLMTWAGLCLAVLSGLHIRISEVLIGSYAVLPAAAYPDATLLKGWGVGRIAWAFALAVQIAAPYLAVSLIYNVALGFINRAMPQLMVAYVGAPAITLGALLLMLIAVPAGLAVWSDAVLALLADPFGAPG